MPALFITNTVHIQRYADAVYGVAIGSATLAQVNADITARGGNLDSALNAYYAASATPNATVATNLVKNIGIAVGTGSITAQQVTDAVTYVTALLNANKGNEGATIKNLLNTFANATADATYGAAVVKYNADVDTALAYSGTADMTAGTVVATPFILTTNADNFIGTAGNDTFNAVAGTGATLALTDNITGGAGTDTFSVITDGNFTIAGTMVTGIETLQVNAAGAAVATLSAVSGLKTVINNASAASLTIGVAGASAGAVSNVVDLTLNSVAAATVLSYSDSALTGSADSMTLNVSSTGSGTTQRAVTISQNTAAPAANQLETLNIVATGTNGITLTTDATQTSLKTVNISGTGNLFLGVANDNIITSATVISASAASGAVVIGGDTGTTGDAGGQALGVASHSVTLGAGNDSVFMGANLTSADTLVGGAGTDTLGVSAAVTNATMTNVSGFEVLRLDAGAGLSQDAGITSLAGFSYALVSAAQTYTLTNLASAATISVLGGAATTTALTMSLKDSSGLADNLNVSISNGASNAATTLTTLTAVTGLETLNLSSTGGTGTNVITTLAGTNNVVLTGSSNLTVTANASLSFNASAFTGKLTTTLGNTAANISSGTGADTITGGTAGDTVNGGAGNDLIINGAVNAATGADVLFGAAGNDTFQLQAGTVAGTVTDYATVLTIKDFTVGTSTAASDFIALSGSAVYGGVALTTGAGAAANTATAEVAVVQTIAQSAAAAAVAGTANIFKLTTGVAFTTDLQGTFNAAIGTATITGLGTTSGVAVVFYDTTNSKAVLAAAQTATAGDTILATGDLVRIIGAIDMTAADYANFNATNFAIFVA